MEPSSSIQRPGNGNRVGRLAMVAPPENVRSAVAELTRAKGLRQAAAALELSVPTVAKLAGGLDVQRATIEHVEGKLEAFAASPVQG